MCALALVLGKGEVVSSILTGSTRHAPTCGLFVLAFFLSEVPALLRKPRGLVARAMAGRSLRFAEIAIGTRALCAFAWGDGSLDAAAHAVFPSLRDGDLPARRGSAAMYSL